MDTGARGEIRRVSHPSYVAVFAEGLSEMAHTELETGLGTLPAGPRGLVPSGARAAGEVKVLVGPSRPWTVVLSLVGDHDLTTVDALRRHAAAHLDRCDRLVIDLSPTTFVDSAVVNALVELARQARPRGVNLQVVAVPGHPAHRVLDLMGLLAHLGWTDCLPELRASTAANGTSGPARRPKPSR